jgi:uncharacterized protein (TIGR02001 family)
MKNLTKMVLGTVSLVGLLSTTSGIALAQDAAAAAPPAPDYALSGYLQVTTDYRFRGIAQNNRVPSPQGTLNLTGPEGFYVGAWASTVDWTPGNNNNPYAEVDIYGGKHTDLWGTDWNIEPYYYSYPFADIPAGTAKPDYFELIDQLTHTWGAFTAVATYAWSPDFPFNGGTGNYLAGTGTYVINDWLSLSGNVGHQWAAAAKLATPKSRDYTYFDIGGTLTYKAFAFDLRYSGTDLGGVQCASFWMATKNACVGTVVGTLTYNFAL